MRVERYDKYGDLVVDRDRGVKLDLYDYSDTGKTSPLLPYYVELFDPEKPYLGVTEKRYLVLERTQPAELYSYRISPVEDVFGEDGEPI